MESAKECIEELLKFTLQSHVNETLGFDLCLSKEFCSNLLQDDPDDSFSLPLTPDRSSNCDPFDGVPRYPLFKRLASAIYHSIVSGALCRTYDKAEFSSEDGCLKQKEEEWEKSILEKGTQIMDILKSVSHELHVQEPFFSLLKDGVKTIEGRCAGGIHDRMKPGFVILLNKSVVLEVEAIHHYVSFSKMLEAEGLGKVLPGVETIEEGVKIYRSFYTEERERSNGVLAILVLKLAAQPYIVLASLLSELSYSGLQSLLGVGHTAGSVSGALPPPRSTLLSSFVLPYNPNIKGSALTYGARALVKHAERSSNKYWGTLSGNDRAKNKLAMDVINCFLNSCRWSNVHIVPQHGVVFEIRMFNGFGARWSKDGTKFIGFLEPYMEDGHKKGWRH